MAPPSLNKPGPTNYDIPALLKAYKTSGGPTANFDLARYILANAQVDWGKVSPLNANIGAANPDHKPGPSVISRIFDILMRGTYASAEAARQVAIGKEPGQDNVDQISDVIMGAARGFAGKEKTTYSKVIKEIDPKWAKNNSVATGALGLAGDIFLDPTTYIGVGAIRGAGNLVRRAVGKGTKKSATPPPQAVTSITANAPAKGLNPATGFFNTATTFAGKLNLPNAIGPTQLAPPSTITSKASASQAKILDDIVSTLDTNFAHRPDAKKFVIEDIDSFLKGSRSADDIEILLRGTDDYNIFTGSSIDNLVNLVKQAKAAGVTNISRAVNPAAKKSSNLFSSSQGALKANLFPPALNIPPVAIPEAASRQGLESMTTAQLRDTIKKVAAGLQGPAYKKVMSGNNATTKGLKGLTKKQLIDTLANLQKTHGISELGNSSSAAAIERAKLLRDFALRRRGQFPSEDNLLNFARATGASPELISTLEKGTSRAAKASPTEKIITGEVPPTAKLTTKAVAAANEMAAATSAADKYFNRTLSRPNRFSNKAHTYNPAQQANFFQNMLLAGDGSEAVKLLRSQGIRNPHSPRFTKKRFSTAYRMLKIAEANFEARGIVPSFWDGSAIKLSDVIDAVGGPNSITKELYTQLITAFKNKNGFDKITNPKIIEAIKTLQAGNAAAEAPLLRLALDQTTNHAAVAQQVLSDSKYKQFIKQVADNQKKMLATQGASPAAQKAGATLTRNIFALNNTLPQLATNAHGRTIVGYITPGASSRIKWAPVANAQANAIATTLGTSRPSILGRQIGPANKAVEFFGGHFATWYGQKELRPDALVKIASAMNNTAVRATVWNNVAKKYTPEQIELAFKAAQGLNSPTVATAPPELIGQFQKSLEDLFKSAGLNEAANQASSVALRSGMLIDDINRQLRVAKSAFRFTNSAKVRHPITGDILDFSKGTDWLNSWQAAKVADPLSFMMHMETAVEQVMHQYAFMDELIARYGSVVRGGEFTTPVASLTQRTHKGTGKALKPTITGQSRLLGVYFPKDIAEQVHRVFSTWDQIYDPKSELMRFLDRATTAWKSGVTIYSPAHHVRNFIGDSYLSWLAGVNDPRVYQKSAKIIHSQRKLYEGGLVPIEQLLGKDAISQALTRPGDKVVRTKSGVDLTAEQVYIAAHRTGILSKAKILEDLVGDPLIKFKPLGGHAQKFAQTFAEIREHHVRLAHFIDILQKSNEKDLPRLFAEASKTVRKWHPDGLDLTKTERTVMRRIFPFYSWTRKTVPLIIEGALTKPAKTTVYPKGMYAVQQMMGIESPSPSDPFPTDQLFPDWIKEKGIGPILGSGDSGYGIINPSNPTIDLVAQFLGTGRPQDPLSGVAQMVTPFARVPAELATGRTVQGVPTNYDTSRYLLEQIPIASMAPRLGNVDFMGTTERGKKQGIPNVAGIINYLTAMGYIPTKNYEDSAEFERMEKRRN